MKPGSCDWAHASGDQRRSEPASSRQLPSLRGMSCDERSRSTMVTRPPTTTASSARRRKLTVADAGPCVGLDGIEPTTSPLSGVRSNRLSYSPAEPHTLQPSRQCVRPLRRRQLRHLRLSTQVQRAGGRRSSSSTVTRTPPVRSLIRLNMIAITTLKATPTVATMSPMIRARRKITMPSMVQLS